MSVGPFQNLFIGPSAADAFFERIIIHREKIEAAFIKTAPEVGVILGREPAGRMYPRWDSGRPR